MICGATPTRSPAAWSKPAATAGFSSSRTTSPATPWPRTPAAIVEQLGGKVAGMAAYPFPGTTDFSAYIVQAQASKAKVLCLANAGDDTANCIKQAHEFGLPQSGVKIAALVYQDYIARSVGLEHGAGHHRRDAVLLGHERRYPSFCGPLHAALSQRSAELLSCWFLLGGDALPEGGGRDGAGQGEGQRPRGGGADEGAAGGRSAVWHRHRAGRRQIHPCQPRLGDKDSG